MEKKKQILGGQVVDLVIPSNTCHTFALIFLIFLCKYNMKKLWEINIFYDVSYFIQTFTFYVNKLYYSPTG